MEIDTSDTRNIARVTTKRIFITGEEWLYYKIYCGSRTADHILVETLYPLIQSLLEKKMIDQWFFIRYGDPDFHIRIRFHVLDASFLGTVISELKKGLGPYVEEDIIYKVQTDTYIRELERYGHQNMEASERLFFRESQVLLELREMVVDESLYFLSIIKMIDLLLADFGYDDQQKLQIATANATSFKTEFEAGKYLTKQLDKKYRNTQEQIHTLFSNPTSNEEFTIIDTLLRRYQEQRTADIRSVDHFLETTTENLSKNSLISSYIHMLVNRAFRSKQRFYELVCYDFLSRYYRRLVFSKKK